MIKEIPEDRPTEHFVSVDQNIQKDLTRNYDYEKLVEEELDEYCNIEIRDDLREGGIHAIKAWDYWFRFLSEKIWKTELFSEVTSFANSIENPKILSLGCGYGGYELNIAKSLNKPYEIVAIDINQQIFSKAADEAKTNDLNVNFETADLNFLQIKEKSFDIIYAHSSIHHVINLENLMLQISRGLKQGGRFIVLDIIGRNRVVFWEENIDFAKSIIEQMPLEYKSGILNIDEIIPPIDVFRGMEGIRQEEIEPEILKYFKAIKCFKYGAFSRIICTNKYIGTNMDPEKEEDKNYLEYLFNLDLQQIEESRLRPTEMFAVFQKKGFVDYFNIGNRDDLGEGGINALKAWDYWFRFLSEKIWKTELFSEVTSFANSIENPKILSLGCGYGGHELNIAKSLNKPYEIVAIDINQQIFSKAADEAKTNDLNVNFETADLNFLQIKEKSFDIIYAHSSIHHVINLENLMLQISRGLKQGGRFIVLDIIGRNRVVFWEENIDFAKSIIEQMPLEYKSGILNIDEIIPPIDVFRGMEGIRQEEIEPEILKYFKAIKCFKYGAFSRIICTNKYIGTNMDPEKEEDKNYLEYLFNLDLQQIEESRLRPTEMFAVFQKKGFVDYFNIGNRDDLGEGGINALKAWDYWFRFLSEKIWKTSLFSEVTSFANSIENPKILSLGCGYGGHELNIAKSLNKPYEIVAIDINQQIFSKAADEAKTNDLNVNFETADLNFLQIKEKSFDIIYAHSSIHHVINLENLMLQISRGLKQGGRFIVLDIIGRNRVVFWEENIDFAKSIIEQMPLEYKSGILNIDEIIPPIDVFRGMEGIRQEEIEPEILKYFKAIKCFKYGAFSRIICTNKYIGTNMDPEKEEDKNYLEYLFNLDLQQIEESRLRPTEMFAVFQKKV